MLASCDRVPAIFEGVDMEGMTMCAGIEKVLAASARACAWFPVDVSPACLVWS